MLNWRKILLNLLWRIFFKMNYLNSLFWNNNKGIFISCMLKLLQSHRPASPLRILCSINNVLDYIKYAWLQATWVLCDSMNYFFNSTWLFQETQQPIFTSFQIIFSFPFIYIFKCLNTPRNYEHMALTTQYLYLIYRRLNSKITSKWNHCIRDRFKPTSSLNIWPLSFWQQITWLSSFE